jgi:hypothetical protein
LRHIIGPWLKDRHHRASGLGHEDVVRINRCIGAGRHRFRPFYRATWHIRDKHRLEKHWKRHDARRNPVFLHDAGTLCSSLRQDMPCRAAFP